VPPLAAAQEFGPEMLRARARQRSSLGSTARCCPNDGLPVRTSPTGSTAVLLADGEMFGTIATRRSAGNVPDQPEARFAGHPWPNATSVLIRGNRTVRERNG